MSENRKSYPANVALFLQQKALLDAFLERNAIDRRQYEKSLNGLREKLGITDTGEAADIPIDEKGGVL